jgi:hypothetical protein
MSEPASKKGGLRSQDYCPSTLFISDGDYAHIRRLGDPILQ